MLKDVSMVLDQFAGYTYFGSTLVQYFWFSVAILSAMLVAKILYFFIKKYGTILTSKTENEFDDLVIEAVETPILFGGFIVGLIIGYQLLTPDVEFIVTGFPGAIVALVILNFMWLALKLIDGFIEHIVVPLSSKTDSKLDDQLIPIIRKVAKVSVVFVALIVILSNFGVDVLPLIAGLGIGGLAIAFAAQKTVEDMFGGISIFSAKPFLVGDMVSVSGVEGKVESVGIRYTRIRDLDGRLNTMPNAQVAQGTIKNITSEPTRRVSVKLGLVYSTPYKKMKQAMETLVDVVKKHPDTVHDDIRSVFKDYSSSSLDIWFV
ncbi:MAG: mechanosensitive ion channel family protein, partial [archaeon]|nr:mechanosensitive ion channel family protein [archaeon]